MRGSVVISRKLTDLFVRTISDTTLRGFHPASELYRPSDRSLSAKLAPTFADRGCRVFSATDYHGR
jgi:hypothetical protein